MMNLGPRMAFSSVLRRRRRLRHFDHHPLQDLLAGRGPRAGAPGASGDGGLSRSGWFVVVLLTQTLIVHMIRTPRLPLLQSRAKAALTAVRAGLIAPGLWLRLGPPAGYVRLQPLPLAFYPWLVGILAAYCAATTAMQPLYVRRFGWQ